MFRILRWGVCGYLGYLAFSFLFGVLEGRSGRSGRAASRSLERSLDTDTPRGNLSNSVRGQLQSTNEASGHAETHRVGRGVVAR